MSSAESVRRAVNVVTPLSREYPPDSLQMRSATARLVGVSTTQTWTLCDRATSCSPNSGSTTRATVWDLVLMLSSLATPWVAVQGPRIDRRTFAHTRTPTPPRTSRARARPTEQPGRQGCGSHPIQGLGRGTGSSRGMGSRISGWGAAASKSAATLFRPERVVNRMDRMPWIIATGQAWKLRVFYVLIVLTFILQTLFISSIRGINIVSSLSEKENAALFVTTGIGALLWLVLSIRCPACDALPVWTILREADASRWLLELRRSDRCAVCGQQGSPVRED